MITSKRIYLLAILVLLFSAYAMQADAGDPCKGASCDPLPPKAQACEHGNVDNKSKCPDHPEGLPPAPTRESPFPIIPVTREPLPTPTPPYHKATSMPFQTPIPPSPTMPPPYASPTRQLANDVQPCYPVTDLGPDDVALLIEAVAEGYSIIIVKDVIATSSDDIVVIGND